MSFLVRCCLPPFFALSAGVGLSLSVNAHAQQISDGRGEMSVAEAKEELSGLQAELRARMTRDQAQMFMTNLLIDRRIEQAARAAGLDKHAAVQQAIARATRNVLVRAFVDQEVQKMASGLLPNLEGLARERYEVNKAAYKAPEVVRVAHILLKVDPDKSCDDETVRQQAVKLLEQLRGGADFGKLASEYSQDPGSARGQGVVPGWSPRGKFVPPFEEAAFSLPINSLSEPIRTRFGYHIIKPLERREARVLPFDEVKDQIINGLRNELLAEKRDQWMKQFKGTREVIVDDAAFEALTKP